MVDFGEELHKTHMGMFYAHRYTARISGVYAPIQTAVKKLVDTALEAVKWTDKAIESGYSDDLFKSAMDELEEALNEYKKTIAQ